MNTAAKYRARSIYDDPLEHSVMQLLSIVIVFQILTNVPTLRATIQIKHQPPGISHTGPSHYCTNAWSVNNRWPSWMSSKSLHELQEVGIYQGVKLLNKIGYQQFKKKKYIVSFYCRLVYRNKTFIRRDISLHVLIKLLI